MGQALSYSLSQESSLSFFFSFLAISQFGLLSHIIPFRLSSGHWGLVFTLRTDDTTHTSLSRSPSLLVDTSLWATSLLAVAVRCLFCGLFFCFFFFLFSQLCCPLRFQNSPQTHLWEGFLLFGNFCFTTPSSGRISVPNSFVSLFVFYILFYLLSKRMGCLSECLVSSASIQKLFCGSWSAFKWSFDAFVGEKVVSLSYSSTILGLPPLTLYF